MNNKKMKRLCFAFCLTWLCFFVCLTLTLIFSRTFAESEGLKFESAVAVYGFIGGTLFGGLLTVLASDLPDFLNIVPAASEDEVRTSHESKPVKDYTLHEIKAHCEKQENCNKNCKFYKICTADDRSADQWDIVDIPPGTEKHTTSVNDSGIEERQIDNERTVC